MTTGEAPRLAEAAGSLAGKRVMVTAGARGIGRAIALAFHDAGARVEVCDVEAEALEAFAAEAPGVGTTCADVSDEAAVEGFFDEALGRLGGLDVLVNNAGITGPTAPVEEVAFADWQATVAVNLDGCFLCSRKAAPILKEAGQGAIINLSSTAGLFGYPLRTPYASAKWAVIGFTKSLAAELGPHGVRVNAICPGPVEGERMVRVIAAQSAARGIEEAEIRRDYEESVSLRRFVTVEDIAATALFLCSDAGAAISGQAIPVDGHTESLT